LEFNSNVDECFLEQAEEEAFSILLGQRQAYNEKWRGGSFFQRGKSTLRLVGIWVCVLGFVLSLYLFIASPRWCPSSLSPGILLLFFILCGVLFYLFPAIEAWNREWVERVSLKSCRKMAERCVGSARSAIPFNACYEMKQGELYYYRQAIEGDCDDADKKQSREGKEIWKRKLKGIGVHGESVTLLFRKWQSIHPTVVILHRDFAQLKPLLDTTQIDYQPLDAEDA